MITPGFFALSLLGLTGLTVKTTTPRALCPTPVAVEEQLAERLQVVGTNGHDWTLELENGHAFGPPAQDFIIVHLFDDHRTLLLDQRIEVTGADCGLRARSVALVVAEFLENSAQQAAPSPKPVAPPSLSETEPSAPAPTPKSDTAATTTPHVTGEKAAPPAGPWLSVGAAAALFDDHFGGALRLGFRPEPSLELSLLATLSGAHHESIGTGSASLQALPLRLGASSILPLGPLSMWFGADAFFSYEWAKTEGLARNRSNERAVFGLGGQFGLRAPVVGRLGAFGLAAADYVLPLAGSRFEIDGREVLPPGPARWAFVLGLEIDALGRR